MLFHTQVQEECGIEVIKMQKKAEITFHFEQDPRPWLVRDCLAPKWRVLSGMLQPLFLVAPSKQALATKTVRSPL